MFMWMGALIASTILSALLLIITLAGIEAGTKVKSGWLALTFCSLAAVAGLIFLKPEVKMEQVQYMPAPPPVLENEQKEQKEQKDATVKKEVPKLTETPGGLADGGKSHGNSLSEEDKPPENME